MGFERSARRVAIACALAALVIEGCGGKKVKAPPPPSAAQRPAPPVPGQTERGLASWYGHPYHGRPAADGEIYDMETMVAAHRTLPFQTWVRVRNLANDKTVDVRIIDRGPFVGGRILDLSHAAAQRIELIGPGVGQVELTVISAPANEAPAAFGVQVGAFRERANADRMQQSMVSAYGAGLLVERFGDPPLWRVLAGRADSQAEAEVLAQRIRAEQHLPDAFVVRLDP
jgi:rare lipoprotein A